MPYLTEKQIDKKRIKLEIDFSLEFDLWQEGIVKQYQRQILRGNIPTGLTDEEESTLEQILFLHYGSTYESFLTYNPLNFVQTSEGNVQSVFADLSDSLADRTLEQLPIQKKQILDTTNKWFFASYQDALDMFETIPSSAALALTAARILNNLFNSRLTVTSMFETLWPSELSRQEGTDIANPVLIALAPGATEGKNEDRDDFNEIIPLTASESSVMMEEGVDDGDLAAVLTTTAIMRKRVKVWRAILDKKTRAGHRRADGQRRTIDKPFNVMGEKLRFPGDSSLGATARNLLNCRCFADYL